MVNVLVSGLSLSGFKPWPGTLFYVQMGTANLMLEVNPAMD